MAHTPARPEAAPAQPDPGRPGEQAGPPRIGQSQAAPAVPERPVLAPGVKLAGQMTESAFKDPPWLIEREGGGYLQVNELLHRIAEQCNGRQTPEQIAERVSEAMGRETDAGMVGRLIVNPLIALGLVARADGTAVPTVPTSGRALLQMNLKMAMISPRLIAPLTAVLRVLFWPPILLLVLAATAVAQGWMYFVHGVGGSVHDALYTPALMLLAVGVVIVAAGFHELGHAAALRYGGGEIKAMGVGVYLVYPAFYTDVSDNYRLGRWARVRTDLGGFYFNLIFVLAVMGLYVATGYEFLLLIVVLINLEIVHQLLPFVRLDGYWVLADLTGIPDFFSHMAAFVRSMVPGLGLKGARLPELKWWGKAVFAGYILITVPLLLFLVFIMIRSLPRILATAWDSYLQLGGDFAAARGSGDGLGMAAALVQILFLSLPTAGLFLTLYTLGRRITVFLWNWSKPSATRKAISGVGSVAAIALLGFLWAPQLPFTGRPGPLYERADFSPIRRDERGTLFDAVGVSEPAGPPVPATPAAVPSPQAQPQAQPAASPAEGIGPASAPTGEATASPAPAVAPVAPPTTAPAGSPAPTPPAAVPAAPTAAPKAPAVATPPPAPAATTPAPTAPPAQAAPPATLAPAPTRAPAATAPPAGAPAPTPRPALTPTPVR